MSRDTHNLVFILANERARVEWDDIEMNPYTFLANFRLGEAAFYDEPRTHRGYELKENITEEMFQENLSIDFNSLALIELRRKGLITPGITPEKAYCYLHHGTADLGYIFLFGDVDLANLKKAGIGYRILK